MLGLIVGLFVMLWIAFSGSDFEGRMLNLVIFLAFMFGFPWLLQELYDLGLVTGIAYSFSELLYHIIMLIMLGKSFFKKIENHKQWLEKHDPDNPYLQKSKQ